MEAPTRGMRRAPAALEATAAVSDRPLGSELLDGLLATGEGRAVWELRVNPLLGALARAALALSCKAGHRLRQERVAQGEEGELLLNKREAYKGVGELRAALALGLELDHGLAFHVARYGTVDALAWLLDSTHALRCVHTTKSTVWFCAAQADADRVGKLEVLNERIPGMWSEPVCRGASDYGHVDALRWLYEHGAQGMFNEHMVMWAAHHGQLESLEFLVTHGCPWSRVGCLGVAHSRGHDHVAAWIVQQPMQQDELEA